MVVTQLMRVTHVHSVSVFVGSLEQVEDFYANGLLLPFGTSREGLRALFVGDTALALFTAGTEDQALVGRNTGIALRTRGEGDFDQLSRQLQNAGHTLGEQRTTPSGRAAPIKDPAGNQLWLWDAPNESEFPHLFDAPALVTIGVRDLRRSLPFYHGIMELPMIEQVGPQTAIFFPNSTRVVLASGPEWTPSLPVTGETGLCLSVEDLPSYVDGLRHRGVEIVEETVSNGDLVAAAVKDPDGNQLTLMSAGD
jgi:predicted enzyme related to lactoylglutathione lyase